MSEHELVLDLVTAYVDRDPQQVRTVAAAIESSGRIESLLEVMTAFAANVLDAKSTTLAEMGTTQISDEIRALLAILPIHEELVTGTIVDDVLAGRMRAAHDTASGAAALAMHITAAYIVTVMEAASTR